ncbi:MAG: amino acid ABC transporter permease [Acidaminococcaceae bacterium]
MKIWQLFWAQPHKKLKPVQVFVNLGLVYLALLGLLWGTLATLNLTFDFSFVQDFQLRILDGFLLTFYLSLASLCCSLILGTLSALGQLSPFLALRYLCQTYITFIRGTPLITQIYLFFYILGTAWGLENRFWSGVIILSLFEGAYIAEIIRGSLLSLDPQQLEAAKAVGFTRKQTLRHIVLPQLLARTIPALTGQFASIIKDSSLLSMIAVIELTQTFREISATNFQLFECYFLLGLLYLALTLPIAVISKALERRFNYET